MIEWLANNLNVLATLGSACTVYYAIRRAAKKDVLDVKSDIVGIKQEIVGIKQEITEMKKDIRSIDNRLSKMEGRMEADTINKLDKIINLQEK